MNNLTVSALAARELRGQPYQTYLAARRFTTEFLRQYTQSA
jgi:hypothetical protein